MDPRYTTQYSRLLAKRLSLLCRFDAYDLLFLICYPGFIVDVRRLSEAKNMLGED